MVRFRTLYVLSLVAVLPAGLAYSQTLNATLLGTVTDISGAVVPSAKVAITEVNTNVSRTGQTDDRGNYSFPDLSPGNYSVTVEAAGFKKETRTDLTVLVDTVTRSDIQLGPGAVMETIEVTGAPPLLQTGTAGTGQKIETEVLRDQPLISSNRNFRGLLNLVPGVAPVQEQHSQFFNASTSLQTEVNGQMRQGNNFMIDGTDDNERTGVLQIYIPPIEAIQTVDFSLSNRDPEMGRAPGAVVNAVLKSGTNRLIYVWGPRGSQG